MKLTLEKKEIRVKWLLRCHSCFSSCIFMPAIRITGARNFGMDTRTPVIFTKLFCMVCCMISKLFCVASIMAFISSFPATGSVFEGSASSAFSEIGSAVADALGLKDIGVDSFAGKGDTGLLVTFLGIFFAGFTGLPVMGAAFAGFPVAGAAFIGLLIHGAAFTGLLVIGPAFAGLLVTGVDPLTGPPIEPCFVVPF